MTLSSSQPEPSTVAKKRFLDMPGLGPLTYLLSAASMTLGAARILAPAFGWEKTEVDTWGQAGIAGTLFAYAMCLMGTLVLIRALVRRIVKGSKAEVGA